MIVLRQSEKCFQLALQVNFILRIVDRLQANLDKIDVALKANLPEEEQAQFVIAAFDDLIMNCQCVNFSLIDLFPRFQASPRL